MLSIYLIFSATVNPAIFSGAKIFLGSKPMPVSDDDNLIAICEPII
jgi:hypothetical protein